MKEYYINILARAFKAFFELNYYFCTGNNKKSIPDVGALLYYKWLSSEISVYWPITPYGLIDELSRRGKAEGSFSFLYFKPDSYTRFKNFIPSIMSFTKEEHPVIKDLALFVECAKNRVFEDEYGEVIIEDDKAFKEGVSSYSPYYTEYLHNIALYLGLTEPMYLVNVRGFKASEEADEILAGVTFDKIFEASVVLCCDKLNMLFPDNYPFFTEQIVKDLLKHPVDTDEMFRFILKDYDVDLDELPDITAIDEEAEPVDEGKLAATYFLGIMLTKWFYTVFGYYLNMIRPYCSLYSEIFNPMQYYVNNGQNLDYNQKGALFMAVPGGYSLTAFGESFFGVKDKTRSIENMLLSKLSFKEVFDDITSAFGLKTEKPDFKQEKVKTLKFKIYNEDKPKNAKYFEFSEYNYLAEIYYAAASSFPMRPVVGYSIFTNENRSIFSEYTSGESERMVKRTELTFLNEVVSEEGDRLYIRINKKPHARDKKQYYDFVAEFLGRGEKKQGIQYPIEMRDSL